MIVVGMLKVEIYYDCRWFMGDGPEIGLNLM